MWQFVCLSGLVVLRAHLSQFLDNIQTMTAVDSFEVHISMFHAFFMLQEWAI